MDFKNVITPRGFLSVGGIVLVLLGVLGFVGIIGPTSSQSIFGDLWWFDNAENVAHFVLGVVALLAVSLVKDAGVHRFLAIAVGALAAVVALLNFGPTVILGANLESPMDMLLHVLVAVWGLLAAFRPMGARA